MNQTINFRALAEAEPIEAAAPRRSVWLFSLVLLIALACVGLFPFQRTIPGAFVVATDPPRVTLRAGRSGPIAFSLTDLGLEVRPGEEIARIEDPRDRQTRGALASRLEILQRATVQQAQGLGLSALSLENVADHETVADFSAEVARRQALRLDDARAGARESAQIDLQEARVEASGIRARLRSEQQTLENLRQLEARGFASRVRVATAEGVVTDLQTRLDLLSLREREIQHSLARDAGSMPVDPSLTALDRLSNTLADLQRTQADLDALDQTIALGVMRSPIEGQLVELGLSQRGSNVLAGDAVAVIEPLDRRRIAMVEIAPESLGAVRTGLPVRLEFTGDQTGRRLNTGGTVMRTGETTPNGVPFVVVTFPSGDALPVGARGRAFITLGAEPLVFRLFQRRV